MKAKIVECKGALDMVREIVYNLASSQDESCHGFCQPAHGTTPAAMQVGLSISTGREESDIEEVITRFS